MDHSSIVITACFPEQLVGTVIRPESDFDIDERHPDVQFLFLFPVVDLFQRSATDFAGFIDFMELEMERHVLDPQERRVG